MTIGGPGNLESNNNLVPVENNDNQSSNLRQNDLSTNRPSIEKARKMSWWKRLFSSGNVSDDLVAEIGEPIRQARHEGVQVQEEKRRLDRVACPERIRQPEDVYQLINMVDQMDARQFRGRKLQEKYGEGLLNRWRAELENQEFSINVFGEIQHDWWAELKRRGLEIATDRRTLVGTAVVVVVGVLTGGIGAAAVGGVIGAFGGRSLGEAVEAAYGKDRKLRAELARLQYEHFQDLRKIATEIRSAQNDKDRVKHINRLVDAYYRESNDIVRNKSELAQEKEKWDKIKGYITMAGSLIGAGSVLAGQWDQAAHTGYDKVKFYDFDKVNGAHSIEKINNEWIYHIRDAQGHITGTHALGGVPTEEMLKHFTIKEIADKSIAEKIMQQSAANLGQGVAAIFGAGLAHFLIKPSQDSHDYIQENARAKERILRDVPEQNTTENIEQQEKEMKVGQIISFNFINGIERGLREPATRPYNFSDFVHENRLNFPSPDGLPFGTYRIESIDEDSVKVALMDPVYTNRVQVTASNTPMIFTITKEELTNNAIFDARSAEERNYQQVFEQYAQFCNKAMPKVNSIWNFDHAKYISMFGRNREIDILDSRRRWRIAQIKDNQVILEPLEDSRDVKAPGVANMEIHVADLIRHGIVERTERDVADDQMILKRLNIDPINIGEHNFMSPDIDGMYDINGHVIVKNQLFKLNHIDLHTGKATLEALKTIEVGDRKEKPRVIVNIRDLETPWQMQALTNKEQEQNNESENNQSALKDFQEQVAQALSLSEEEKNSIKKGIVFEIGGILYAFQSYKPKASSDQVTFYEVNQQVIPAISPTKKSPAKPESIKYNIDWTKRQNYADIVVFLAASPELTNIEVK